MRHGITSPLPVSRCRRVPRRKPCGRIDPARGWAAFNYDRKDIAPVDGIITVREITGRVVATLPMQGPIGQQVWDTRQVAPGSYMVEFRVDGKLLHAEKLIVQQ